MVQGFLFNEFPQLEVVCAAHTVEESMSLASIALAALPTPMILSSSLLIGRTPTEALMRLVGYSEWSIAHYVVKVGERIVGYVGVFTGESPLEENTDPAVCAAFLTPELQREFPQVQNQFPALLTEVQERYGGW